MWPKPFTDYISARLPSSRDRSWRQSAFGMTDSNQVLAKLTKVQVRVLLRCNPRRSVHIQNWPDAREIRTYYSDQSV